MKKKTGLRKKWTDFDALTLLPAGTKKEISGEHGVPELTETIEIDLELSATDFRDIVEKKDFGKRVETKTFQVCGIEWCLWLYPVGLEWNGEYVAVRLVNKSRKEVKAGFEIRILNQLPPKSGGEDVCWIDDVCVFTPYSLQKDTSQATLSATAAAAAAKSLSEVPLHELLPSQAQMAQRALATAEREARELKKVEAIAIEEAREVAADKSSDAMWGTDEFVLTNDLLEECLGLCVDSIVKFSVRIEYYGEIALSAHPLTKAIERNQGNNVNELIALANEDLALLSSKLPVGKITANTLKSQQDNILLNRLGSPVTSPSKKMSIMSGKTEIHQSP